MLNQTTPNGTTPTTSSLTCHVNDSTSVMTAKMFGYSTVFLASLVGNSLILNAVLKDMSARKSINHFMANICLANLLITIVYMPRMMVMIVDGSYWLVGGVVGLALCKLVPVIHHACILVSILSLAALSVDRFFYIVIPTKRFLSERKLKVTILLMWVTGIIVRFPSLYALTLTPSSDGAHTVCRGSLAKAFKNDDTREIYYTFLLVVFYFLPLVMMVVLYSVIVVFLRQKTTPTNRYDVDRTSEAKYKEASRKTLTMLITVSVVFVGCWATYFIAQIVHERVPCRMRFWRFFLAHCNSAISPYLCMVFNKKYRERVTDTLYHCCCVCSFCEIVEENDNSH